MLSRSTVHRRILNLYSNPLALTRIVSETTDVPDNISTWLGRLKLLYGVPINYLVPDEKMLPPESIRFFYVDSNWVASLIDGAYSIGRNLTTSEETASFAMDKAAMPVINDGTLDASAAIRANALGLDPPVISFKTITGFLLRSSLVQTYQGMGVNPYPLGKTPTDPNPETLKILRMERLGPDSDTILCLVEGDIYRVDIHEAPEALHYGLNNFEVKNNVIDSKKTIYTFSKSGPPGNSSITMNTKTPVVLNLASNNCFRTTNDNRTVKMQTIANLIGQSQTPKLTTIDSSEMGFEMIEGVGMVSFYNKNLQA